MEVKVLSRETIMPSSQTPPHLKTFQLSLLDQLSPQFYVPLLLFYPMNNNDDHLNHKKEIAKLKSSFSEILSHYFLLAGRIVEKSIRCSDGGAIFIEASVSCNISEILTEPNNEVLTKLLPCLMMCTKPIEECAQILVQANIFNCGGIVISVCMLHKLIDGTTLSCFLKSWASINKGSFDSSPKVACSDYRTFSSLFPPINVLSSHPKLYTNLYLSSERKRSLRRFVLGAKAISDLKSKARSNDVPNPTCVEVVTGFFWRCAIKAASGRFDDSQRLFTLSHAVNLRKRMEPPLSEYSVGNILWNTVVNYSTNENEVELSELVGSLRQSLAEINGSYIKRFMGDEGARVVFDLLGEKNMSPNLYICTSWRNMGLHEVDFGWGKPVWISVASDSNMMMSDGIILMDTASGDGIQVWMILDEKEMKLLEQNEEFLEFASLNPSIHLQQ